MGQGFLTGVKSMNNSSLKILMIGWEFPPFHSGGLGVVCYHLTKALTKQGVEIIFVLPQSFDIKINYMRFLFADLFPGLKLEKIKFLLSAYVTSKIYEKTRNINILSKFSSEDDLSKKVEEYGARTKQAIKNEQFDVIHVHDWLTIPAGIAAMKKSKKPLIVHIHSTEFDRTGGQNINQYVYEIEKWGMEQADLVVAVSNFTKNIIIRNYGIEPSKIRVIYNAIDFSETILDDLFKSKIKDKQIVLFLGRITIQKGPDYFLLAAKKVLEYNPNILFVIAGSGSMEKQIVEMAAELDIADKVLFTGFLRDKELVQIYQIADLYVLSSVSEPFGLTPLEALNYGTPVLISRQSGVSEILSHCLKVDFWDIDEMANKILAVLKHKELQGTLSEEGQKEIKKFTWQGAAKNWIKTYQEMLNG